MHTAGIAGSGHFGEFGTSAGHFRKFGTASIPVPDTSVSSVRHQYLYLRYLCGRLYRGWYRYRYKIDTGAGQFGKFCKTYPGTGHVGKIGMTSKPRYHHMVT